MGLSRELLDFLNVMATGFHQRVVQERESEAA
jgi:hypothetical protein